MQEVPGASSWGILAILRKGGPYGGKDGGKGKGMDKGGGMMAMGNGGWGKGGW